MAAATYLIKKKSQSEMGIFSHLIFAFESPKQTFNWKYAYKNINLHNTSGVVLDPKEWHHLFELHKALWRHKKPPVVLRLKVYIVLRTKRSYWLQIYIFISNLRKLGFSKKMLIFQIWVHYFIWFSPKLIIKNFHGKYLCLFLCYP